jgi:hypothetical protein
MAAITKNRIFLNGQNCSILSQKVMGFTSKLQGM